MKQALSFFLLMSLLAPAVAQEASLPTGVSERRMAAETLWSAVRRLPPSERPKVVVVLGGGGARGLSHIGTLRVLEEEGIPVDEVVGVSVGALIGALYAAGLSVDEIEKMAGEVGWDKLTDYSKFAMLKLILTDELLSSDRMEKYFDKHIGKKTFAELNLPFACVATDIRTGERVVFREGPVAIAARASATIPALFSPVEYRQRLLVDGGLVDNLPIDLVTTSESDAIVVGVLPIANQKVVENPSVFRSLVRSIEIQKDIILKDRRRSTQFLIEPDVEDVGLTDLARYTFCIEAGTLAARERALELKELIIRRTLARRVVKGQR